MPTFAGDMNVKCSLALLLLLSALGCNRESDSKASQQQIASDKEESARVELTKMTRLSAEFIEKLTGLWGSVKYKNELYRTNSMHKAMALTPSHTDILFVGDSTLYAARTDWMEAYPLRFNSSDSTAKDLDNKLVLKILRVSHDELTVQLPKIGQLTYSKIKSSDSLDRDALYEEEQGASKLLNRQWLAGSYALKLGDTTTRVTLLPTGRVLPDSVYREFITYAWKGHDFLFLTDKRSTGQEWRGKGFVIDAVNSAQVALSEIEPLENEESPMVKTGRSGVLVKIKRR